MRRCLLYPVSARTPARFASHSTTDERSPETQLKGEEVSLLAREPLADRVEDVLGELHAVCDGCQ